MSYSAPPPPPEGYGGYGGGYVAPRTNQKAVWALVLGILGLCCGLFAGIPAIVLGASAKKEIARSGGAQTGAGLAQAGFVIGIIVTVLGVLGLLLLLVGVVALPNGSTAP
ncbi:MAG: DUF4190 domain-containing protein [Nocardioidaceae bacterium]